MFMKSRNISVHRDASLSMTFPDLSVGQRDRVLLLGPSGSGKTTFLSVLAGLLKPDTGQVLIDEEDFYDMSTSMRDQLRGRRFGFVFQTLHLLPSLSLAQNILLAADMAGARPEEGRLEYLLDTLGLADKGHRKPDALSQGEQQRAAIARAVLLRPEIIMADELTSALDDENARMVMSLLEKQADDTGAALLIATHDNRIKARFEKVITLEHQIREAS